MTRRTVGVVVATLVVLAVVTATAGPTWAASGGNRRITVVGTGQVTGTPDVADVTIGVSARAKTAADALGVANDRAAKVIATLRDAGVADDDLQTSGLSILPTFDLDTITGYEVTNTVHARLRDIARIGAIIDAAARVAGDEIRVQGISFTIDDDSDLLETARTRAVKRARSQAEQLASAAGVEVGDVLSIDEGGVSIPVQYRAADSASAEGSVPVEPGSQTVSLQATVVFAIG
jgi:uncharacterized protein YggE